MERVSIVEPSRLLERNVIFIAPHGHEKDDVNTGIIARSAAETLGGFAVINNWWRRGGKYDYSQDHNCAWCKRSLRAVF